MCGIGGILSVDPQEREVIHKMAFNLQHRGPDDEGYFHDEQIALTQTRLSIIDLKTGHQPMFSQDKSLVLVCNGEIYNSPELRKNLESQGHQFQTKTDVEVILHLYED